jgi:hypothetical protein
MEHRGVKFTITRDVAFQTWRWRTMLGNPPKLRTGEEASEAQAEVQVKQVIDWFIDSSRSNGGTSTGKDAS